LKLNDIVEVEWDDVVTHSQWLSEEKAVKEMPCVCRSLGYFFNQDDKALRLSCTVQSGDNPERDLTVIPQGAIIKIRKLKGK